MSDSEVSLCHEIGNSFILEKNVKSWSFSEKRDNFGFFGFSVFLHSFSSRSE